MRDLTTYRTFLVCSALMCVAISVAACSNHHERPPAAASEDDRFGKLSDGQIGQVLMSVNTGEVDLGQLAQGNAQSNDVRQFADQMVADHTAARTNTEHVLEAQRITPASGNLSKQLESEAAQAKIELHGRQNADFDRAYMRSQVHMHQEVLLVIDTKLLPETNHVQLRILLGSTRAVMEQHLRMAEGIERDLAEPSTSLP